eukprot:971598-Prymnesium_polylepis.1
MGPCDAASSPAVAVKLPEPRGHASLWCCRTLAALASPTSSQGSVSLCRLPSVSDDRITSGWADATWHSAATLQSCGRA